MNSVSAWLYALAYCALAACVGAFVGAVAGMGMAGILLSAEELAPRGDGAPQDGGLHGGP